MPRDARTDFRGGVNTAFTTESLSSNELRAAVNGRLNAQQGGVVQRPGTRRFHDSAIASGEPILGGFHFKFNGTRQVVVIAGGNLYHKTDAATEFTEVNPTPDAFSTTVRPWFAPFTSGGVTKLYIGDGNLWEWDGTTLTLLDEDDEPEALALKVYKSRMFVTDGTKNLYWSSVADPTEYDSIPPATGGLAQVDTFDDDALVGLATAGSSLILFKSDSIARFTGTSRENIQVDAESQGISREVGCMAPRTIVEFDQFVFFLSDRGVYVATEAAVTDIGSPLDPEWESMNKAAAVNAVAVHNRGGKEIILSIPVGASTVNNRSWVYNYETMSWSGPWEVAGQAFGGFNVCSLWQYEEADGTETFMVGGYDGRVRRGGVGALDDTTRTGTGGTNIPLSVTWDLVFGDPATVKQLMGSQEVTADLGASGSLTIQTSGDLCPTQSITVPSAGAGVRQYRFRPAWRGRRLRLVLTDATAGQTSISGVIFDFLLGRRAV